LWSRTILCNDYNMANDENSSFIPAMPEIVQSTTAEPSQKALINESNGGKREGVWTGFIQNVLVALVVFSFTQLWTEKENNQRIREALFDMKSEIVHNNVLVEDEEQRLERVPIVLLGPEHTFIEGLQTQSLQRNLIFIAEQDEKYSDNLVKYYSDVDDMKKAGNDELAEIGFINQQIQNSESQLNTLAGRRDNFIINEDRIQKNYPSLLKDTERAVETTSRNINKIKRSQQAWQESLRKSLLSHLKLASSEEKVALADIDIIYSGLNLSDDHLYGYMGYLLFFFLAIAFVPAAMRADKKALQKRKAKVNA
jgi:hypothetical protein